MTKTDEYVLTSKEVAAISGLSYRQIDYWTNAGLFDEFFVHEGGSGCPRAWKPAIIPILFVLKDITFAMRSDVESGGRSSSMQFLRNIVDAYPTGEYVLGADINTGGRCCCLGLVEVEANLQLGKPRSFRIVRDGGGALGIYRTVDR